MIFAEEAFHYFNIYINIPIYTFNKCQVNIFPKILLKYNLSIFNNVKQTPAPPPPTFWAV